MDAITVIGGGLAGLVAAIRAAELGAAVRGYEASRSLGGRGRATEPPYIAHEGPHVATPTATCGHGSRSATCSARTVPRRLERWPPVVSGATGTGVGCHRRACCDCSHDVDAAVQRAVTTRFLHASAGGSIAELLDLLAPRRRADQRHRRRRPRAQARAGGTRQGHALPRSDRGHTGFTAQITRISGETGVLVRDHQAVRYAAIAHLAGGRIQTISLISNPAKLAQLNRTGASRGVCG